MTIEELFGTLQQSVVTTWRKHLKTNKYSDHMALDEYYKDAPELIDTLIENYQGTHDKIEEYKNLLDSKYETALDYLSELYKICTEGRELLDSDELRSDMDAILSLMSSVMYKLKELKEGVNLVKFLKESLINESRTTLSEIANYTESWAWDSWSDRDLKNLLISMTNGVYRALSERAVGENVSEKEKNIANKWLDIIEEIYKLIN